MRHTFIILLIALTLTGCGVPRDAQPLTDPFDFVTLNAKIAALQAAMDLLAARVPEQRNFPCAIVTDPSWGRYGMTDIIILDRTKHSNGAIQ